jgi:hypothetical protein
MVYQSPRPHHSYQTEYASAVRVYIQTFYKSISKLFV